MRAAVTKRVEAIVSAAADQCFEIVRAEAQRVLDTSPRYTSFVAAMGVSSFYNGKGPVFDEDLTKDAKAVIELSDEVTTRFGSPGLQLEKGAKCLT